MTYQAPVGDIAFTLKHAAGLKRALDEGLYGDLTEDLVDAVLEEAGKFATDVIAPLNRVGDVHGTPLENGAVKMPPGWKEAYAAWTAAGWNGLAASPDWGGQGLPHLINAACLEMWHAAAMAFGLGPLLTMGAAEALAVHGAEALKRAYLPKLVSGEWMGTMQLTEPQAGSDLSALRTKAERRQDGTYRVTGQKIFITYGEHDLTDNIVHFVLARLPDAPPGSRGISLFLVPKYLVNPDGTLGAKNDVRCHSVEHKLGIHGSPTCTMVYGDDGGAIGFLVGEENRGLACMFTMMNNARLGVGLEGVAVAERATQQALAYARERRQGRAPDAAGPGMSPILAHPDVTRMLLLMRASTRAARAICYMTAAAIDRSHRERDEAARERAQERASLLTPIAKAFSTDIGVEVASLRGDRRRSALPRRAHCHDLRRHQRHPGDRSRHPQAAAVRRRGGTRLPARAARDRGGRPCRQRSSARRDGGAAERRDREPRAHDRLATRRAREPAGSGARRRDALSTAVRGRGRRLRARGGSLGGNAHR